MRYIVVLVQPRTTLEWICHRTSHYFACCHKGHPFPLEWIEQFSFIGASIQMKRKLFVFLHNGKLVHALLYPVDFPPQLHTTFQMESSRFNRENKCLRASTNENLGQPLLGATSSKRHTPHSAGLLNNFYYCVLFGSLCHLSLSQVSWPVGRDLLEERKNSENENRFENEIEVEELWKIDEFLIRWRHTRLGLVKGEQMLVGKNQRGRIYNAILINDMNENYDNPMRYSWLQLWGETGLISKYQLAIQSSTFFLPFFICAWNVINGGSPPSTHTYTRTRIPFTQVTNYKVFRSVKMTGAERLV